MDIKDIIQQAAAKAAHQEFSISLEPSAFVIQETRRDFVGDFTLVTFSLAKELRMAPPKIAQSLGESLPYHLEGMESFEVVQGFLNIRFTDSFWVGYLKSLPQNPRPPKTDQPQKIMVEYSSPNTNKPLHLGHIRNNLIGYSVSEILKARGHEVIKANLINDRGIHICKSMLAWMRFGEGETPEDSGMKGDHLVGKYYVAFDKAYRAEIAELVKSGMEEDEAKKSAPLILEAQEMLRKWEAGDKETRSLWEKMNGWVYEGFNTTYSSLGVDFDKFYYESDTYLLGKDLIEKGLEAGVFFRKSDSSVWCDLSGDGLDEKLVLRADGTAVYITQDIGTASLKVSEFGLDRSIYVVGNEQDYHFKVLRLIMQKLKEPKADGIFHMSYGMVDLPSGKMKSREGTVVDADDLITEMIDTARARTQELGKTGQMAEEDMNSLYRMIGLAALKFYILKTDPKKRILFNPDDSIDFQGNTGPSIQYTHARIQSILRKAMVSTAAPGFSAPGLVLEDLERALTKKLYQFSEVMEEAEKDLSPASVAQYAYDLARLFNSFVHEHHVTKEPDDNKRAFRLWLCYQTAAFLRMSMGVLGIALPERM